MENKTGFIASSFDIMHPGYAMMLKECRDNCDYLVVGLPALRMLAEDPEIKLPILGHMDFAGVFYESPFSGVSSFLIMGKLARLAGADIVVTGTKLEEEKNLKKALGSIVKAVEE